MNSVSPEQCPGQQMSTGKMRHFRDSEINPEKSFIQKAEDLQNKVLVLNVLHSIIPFHIKLNPIPCFPALPPAFLSKLLNAGTSTQSGRGGPVRPRHEAQHAGCPGSCPSGQKRTNLKPIHPYHLFASMQE